MKVSYPRGLWPLLLLLLLAGGAALAQDNTPASGINRNPAYREGLPAAPPPPPDPRDSTTRPVQPAEQLPTDGRSVVVERAPVPQPPASAPALPASRPVLR